VTAALRAVEDAPQEIQPPATPVAAPALGYSITCNLDGNRQIVFQGFVVNRRVDRVMRVVDRQKARYEIEDLRKELLTLNRDFAQGQEDLAKVEADFRKAQAQLDVQILECQRMKAETQERALAAGAASGRSPRSALKGLPSANMERQEKAIADIQDAKLKNEAERTQALEGFSHSQDRRAARITEVYGLVTDKEALLAG
jgi:hypothetical protein